MSGIIGKIGSKTGTVDELDSGLDLVKPHIIPDVLYPAVANIMVDGSTALSAVTTGPNSSTVASSKYGTVQSDGRMYYYTDIKGSKPIKDPRIGSHFGSQRHTTRSLQLLEQETATHGENVHSVDGRNWMRTVNGTSSTAWIVENSLNGNSIRIKEYAHGSFIEITGYFNDINFVVETGSTRGDDCDVYVNGGSATANDTLGGETTSASPLLSRFVSSGSVINVGTTVSNLLGTTPAINTIKFVATGIGGSEEINFHGIELITQDTTSTANKSKIQIPSQNVVSHGKKFTVSGTPHYDPFNGFTNSTTLHSAVVDTATSLGLSTGTLHGATWAISASNNIRPYNGGRVVKWVDSSGVIKTSVNMMPPNAQNISTTAAAEITTPSATNTAYLPAFSDDAVDHSLAEVAKTFHVREFGNGAANGGTGATYADASMLNSQSGIAYVMDDGLTSSSALSATQYSTYNGGIGANDGSYVHHYTFIGTGISVRSASSSGINWYTYAQNLPYGTHILKLANASSNGVVLDGVTLQASGSSGNVHTQSEVTFHQPKMPPIPEDAVVIADYMLMADFVAQSAGTVGHISKGVRSVSPSRDYFHDAVGVSISLTIDSNVPHGFKYSSSGLTSGQTITSKLPYFGTDFLIQHYNNRVGTLTEDLNSDVGTSARIGGATNTYAGLSKHTGNNLTVNRIKNHITDGLNDDEMWTSMTQIATPIHTSSHYQSFETPLLHELTGGDRNMEQTNLVVTPDGKTWDEVTRDVSYIGNMSMRTLVDTNQTTANTIIVHDEWRGIFGSTSNTANFNKDFAIAYDRVICLKDGEYQISYSTHLDSGLSTGSWAKIKVNGSTVSQLYQMDANYNSWFLMVTTRLKRGDYVQLEGFVKEDASFFEINKVS